MSKQTRPATAKEIRDAKALLRKGRNHFDNELMEVERIWAKLKPHDYHARELVLKMTNRMIELNKQLKMWEDKLKS